MNIPCIRALTIGLVVVLSACASNLEQGNQHYARQEYDQAARYWNPLAQQGNPYAQYNLGLLWEFGRGSTQRNVYEAAEWYLRSANQGFVPAMVRLSGIQLSLGNVTPAVSWLNLAARWGNEAAASTLANRGYPVPSADLLHQYQLAQQQKAQENQEAFNGLMALLLLGAVAANSNEADVLPVLSQTSGSATGNTSQPSRGSPVGYSSQPSQGSSAGYSSQGGFAMCPDGSYVDKGPCRLCPDGTYIGGGSCGMAPDGTFLRKSSAGPQMTPNGTFIEGGRGMVMCPDGTFVAGSRCNMTPDGTFVGVGSQ